MAKSKGGKAAKSSNGGKITAKKASNKATNKSTVAGKRNVDGCGEREASNSSTAFARRKRTRRKGDRVSSNKQSMKDDAILSPSSRADYLYKIYASRELNTIRNKADAPDPSNGGSSGYPFPLRKILVNLYQEGSQVPKSMVRSIQRWIKDGVEPKTQTGNKRKTVITGEHLFLLALFQLIWPQATRVECSAFVALYSVD